MRTEQNDNSNSAMRKYAYLNEMWAHACTFDNEGSETKRTEEIYNEGNQELLVLVAISLREGMEPMKIFENKDEFIILSGT